MGFTISNKLEKIVKKLWLFIFIKPFIKHVIVWQASSYTWKRKILRRKFPNATVEIINDGVDFSMPFKMLYQEISKN